MTLPDYRRYTSSEIALELRLSKARVRGIVSEHKALFPVERDSYRRNGRGPRKHRYFNAAEFHLIRSLVEGQYVEENEQPPPQAA